jgi:hypothetical protein
MQHHTLEGLPDLYHPNQKIGQVIQIITRWVYADMLTVGSSRSFSGRLNFRPWPYQTPDGLLVWPSTGQSRNDSDHPSLYGNSVLFYLFLQILFRPCLLVIISGTSTGAGTLQHSASGREATSQLLQF